MSQEPWLASVQLCSERTALEPGMLDFLMVSGCPYQGVGLGFNPLHTGQQNHGMLFKIMLISMAGTQVSTSCH